MEKTYVFYNPLAGHGKILEDLEALEFVLDTSCIFCDMTKPETYGETLFEMSPEDALVICGGDGTLHRFVNLLEGISLPNELYYYPAGEHNDFARDFGRRYGDNPISVTKALKELPTLQAGNKTARFLTGILYFAGDKKRRGQEQNAPQRVRVSADRALHVYEKVRFAALMHGKYCDGSMTPDRKRQRTDNDLSCVLIHGCSRLWANHLLRQLRKGSTPKSRCLTIHRAGEFRLTFENPVRLIVDGDPHTGVSELIACRKESV